MIIFAVLTISNPIFAQKVANSSISVTTDKTSYIFGDTIVISGTVKTVTLGNILTIRILDPYSNLVQTSQAIVSQDGSYTDTIEITGNEWKTSGVYTIQVQYSSAVQTQSTFSFTATTMPIRDTFQIPIPNSQQIFTVPYTISGGSVKDMHVDPSNFSLTVSIQSNNYGAITLSLPRSLLDAKINGTDSSFTILVDSEEIKPQKEQATSQYRTLTIQFLQGDQDIQIIGTSMAYQNNSVIYTPTANLTTNSQSSQTTNMSELIPSVPEFPSGITPFIIALITTIVLTRSFLDK